MPSPTLLHLPGGRDAISRSAYPDLEDFWADIVSAFPLELHRLYDVGCRYLQLDDICFAYLCDLDVRARMRTQGTDPDALVRRYVAVVNASSAGMLADLAITMHTCLGNFRSTWAASGGYELVAEIIFNDLLIDGFFLEYDTERAGGFEPLRHMPKGKKVVLGLGELKACRA